MRRETVPVAAENRSASEFIGTRGLEELEEILRVVRESYRRPSLKDSGVPADKYAEDTAGISDDSREPGPGMMTGTYQAKDSRNV